jgi:type I restriction-modification system DNA methylase subunit
MPIYTCEKCARIFKQKSGYDDHKAKKNDCLQNTMIHTFIENKVEEKIQEVVRAIQPKPQEVVSAIQTKPQITDKTLLPSFFEDLHNLLWNKAGLNPESALAHMTFFFAYRLIEQQADALGLPQECRWSYVANIRNEQDLFDTVKKGVSSFRLNPKTKPFFKPHEIQKCNIVAEIVNQINRISLTTLQETDTLGDVFEYMLGRGMSTMSDEGQYFTNREICKLSFKLAFQIKKKLRRDDGSLCTFADWFCGTGGFPAEYVKGVKTHLQDVDWQKDCESIYCQDMNTSSVTTTLLNMLILTGIPFSDQNIRSSNSFSDAITTGAGAPFPGLSLDYCFMNPPYGGDKTKGNTSLHILRL